jgi:hypothetical protein
MKISFTFDPYSFFIGFPMAQLGAGFHPGYKAQYANYLMEIQALLSP